MIHSEFYIYKDKYGVVEFREKNTNLYKLSFTAIIVGILIIVFSAIRAGSSNSEHLKLIYYFMFVPGGLIFMACGATSLFFKRFIIIDKNNNELLLVVGVRRYFRRPKKILLSDISHIEIKSKMEGLIGEKPMDNIYLILKHNGKIKVEYSELDQYTNEFSYILSKTIGCRVVS